MALPEWPLAPTASDLKSAIERAREQLAGDGYAVAAERGEAFALLADRFARVLVDLVDGRIAGTEAGPLCQPGANAGPECRSPGSDS